MRFIILSLIVCFSFQSNAAEKFEYLVKANNNFIQNFQNPLAQQVEVVRENVIVMNLTPAEAKDLKNQSGVLHIEKNAKLQLFKTPNDLDKGLWGLNNRRKNAETFDINAPAAWDITTGSKDVIVAVIDTGAYIDHSDLMDNLWENTSEMNGIAGVDDDGNGFVDDIFGYDFPKNSGILGDRLGHGTHVSGTIGAKGDNNDGIVGVNWDVSLMILNMFPDRGEGKTSDAIRAIDYAVANGAQVINASWGGPAPRDDEEEADYKLLYESIERAGEAGVTFVAASGNSRNDTDSTPMYPAAYDLDNIISVGAMTNRGRRASFSNYGKTTVDVFAPGSSILSTTKNGRTGKLSGTSMASPHVAGIVGLLLSVNDSLSPDEIKEALINTCVPNSSLKGRAVCNGHVDTHAALLEISN